MSKFCSNCGNELKAEDNVCTSCGTPVNGAAPVSDNEKPIEGKYKTYAIISLVCGICSLVLPLIGGLILSILSITLLKTSSFSWIISLICIGLGIAAIILSVKAKKGGKSGMATAGLVCGIIGLIFSTLGFACYGCISCISCGFRNAVSGVDMKDAMDEFGRFRWNILR